MLYFQKTVIIKVYLKICLINVVLFTTGSVLLPQDIMARLNASAVLMKQGFTRKCVCILSRTVGSNLLNTMFVLTISLNLALNIALQMKSWQII